MRIVMQNQLHFYIYVTLYMHVFKKICISLPKVVFFIFKHLVEWKYIDFALTKKLRIKPEIKHVKTQYKQELK